MQEKIIYIDTVLNDSDFIKNMLKKIISYSINRFIENDELQYFYKAANVVVLPFNKVENSGSVILAMGFKKTVIAPKMGVLQKRLKKQNDFLYEDNKLQDKMEFAYKERELLIEYGEKNFNALKENS